MTPIGNNYHVRFTQGAETTAGGIILPESLRVNYQEAVVLAGGPGKLYGSVSTFQWHHTMWCEPGDTVFFHQNYFKPLDKDTGFIADEHLIGRVLPTGAVEPLNDWVLLGLAEFEQTASAIVLPDEFQRRPNKGVVKDWGPGELRNKGVFKGLLKPVIYVLNLPRDDLKGAVAYWEDGCDVYEFGREWTEGVLVRARDLIAVE